MARLGRSREPVRAVRTGPGPGETLPIRGATRTLLIASAGKST